MNEPSRYFEDLDTGEYAESSPVTVSEEEIVDFATRYDPQYFHMNPEAARSHPQFGEVVASGIHILAINLQIRLIIDAFNGYVLSKNTAADGKTDESK